jgi:hypothetical protein
MRAKDERQWVAGNCGFCGAKIGQYLSHYDVLQCSCGKFSWVLYPKRNGPLTLIAHPSLNGQQKNNAAAD